MSSVAASAPSGARASCTSAEIVEKCTLYAERVCYQKVTLRELCTVSGASERRIRDAFYDCCGAPPTVYLRAAALREARRSLLCRPNVPGAVARAACDFGFWHLSRFAGQYRDVFGESPSETVMQARSSTVESIK